MAATLKTSDRTRQGLIALIALRQARAMRDRRALEQAQKAAHAEDKQRKNISEAKPKKRGWFE